MLDALGGIGVSLEGEPSTEGAPELTATEGDPAAGRKRVPRKRTGGAAGAKRTAPRSGSRAAATQAKQMKDAAELIETGIGAAGIGLGIVGLKTTAHTTLRVAPELAAATVRLAADNPRLLALMGTMSDLTPWFQAGQGLGAIVVAAAVDLGASSPTSFLAVNLDVRADWLATHPDYELNTQTGEIDYRGPDLRSVV